MTHTKKKKGFFKKKKRFISNNTYKGKEDKGKEDKKEEDKKEEDKRKEARRVERENVSRGKILNRVRAKLIITYIYHSILFKKRRIVNSMIKSYVKLFNDRRLPFVSKYENIQILGAFSQDKDYTNIFRNIIKWHYDIDHDEIKCNNILKYIKVDVLTIIYSHGNENYRYLMIDIPRKTLYRNMNKTIIEPIVFGDVCF